MTHMLKPVTSDFPTDFAKGIPTGRYAWSPEEGVALTFVWIKDYTSGKRAGQRRIRTQHGEYFAEAVTFNPNRTVSLWKPQIAEVLVGIYCDPAEAAQRYGSELGTCARLGCKLTDPRSRYYGIGPECEKHWTWFIEAIDNKAGGTYEELIASGRLVMS